MDRSGITKLLLSFYFMFRIASALSQDNQASPGQIIPDLDRLNDTPVLMNFRNRLEINNQGGHIQGIQYLSHKQNGYYILSGSSNDHSYYAVVKTGKENRVISVTKIMENPFRHAGGFQIYKNLMAIGVEDNYAKDRSKIFIFKIDDPENPPETPLVVIDRTGEIRRSTAGCVGITIIRDKVLIVAGDWDTEHLDFYTIDHKDLGHDMKAPTLQYSIDISKTYRTGWIDDKWLSYQNINFIQDDYGNLFLAGMTSDRNDDNVIDIYKIETDNINSFELRKIQTRTFDQSGQARFRWGAGIYITGEKQMKLFTCGEHIEDNSIIEIYE